MVKICKQKPAFISKSGILLCFLFFINYFCIFSISAADDERITSDAADGQAGKNISLRIPYRGKAIVNGELHTGDFIELYSREYRSSEGKITDKLLSRTTAAKGGSVEILYNVYSEPLEENKIAPDFSFHGGDVVINALYAVISDGESEIATDPVYTDCFLDTGVVSQYWCTYVGSEACGPAAGAITLQFLYPVWGNDMYTRINTMRNYCMDGSEYCTGYPLYELVEEQVTNTVNRYVSEELSGELLFTDHRTSEKTTEETLIELLTTGRPVVIEVCYLRGGVMEDFWGYSHWITINGFSLEGSGYWFRYSDPVTVSYVSVSSDLLEKSNKNVSYGNLAAYGNFEAVPTRYIGAFSEPLFSICSDIEK